MKLFYAALCVECDEVVDIREKLDSFCPSCDCAHLVYLSNFVAPMESHAEISLLETKRSAFNRGRPAAS